MVKFDNKVIAIIGGTGSFGNAVIKRLLPTKVGEIRIFSRDEKKQNDMRERYKDRRLKFFVGDVRDYASLLTAVRGSDFIFHAAALKQVPSCEFFPLEAVKTNVLGVENVLEAAYASGVSRVVCLSTDKAVYPINAMGISKAMMEKVITAKSRNIGNTVICITRYGNVMASRGSAIPLFTQQIRAGIPITLTDPQMTRFMMTLDDAVDLVFYAFSQGAAGDIFVQKAPAATIGTLVESIKEVLGAREHEVRIIGARHGEKMHESLLSKEEVAVAEDMGKYFRVPVDSRDLNYDKFFIANESSLGFPEEYSSSNTERLDKEGMIKLLGKLQFVKALADGREEEAEEA